MLVHIDRLDIFKIQYTSRGFELGCEDVKEGGGGGGWEGEGMRSDIEMLSHSPTKRRERGGFNKEITLYKKYIYNSLIVKFDDIFAYC